MTRACSKVTNIEKMKHNHLVLILNFVLKWKTIETKQQNPQSLLCTIHRNWLSKFLNVKDKRYDLNSSTP